MKYAKLKSVQQQDARKQTAQQESIQEEPTFLICRISSEKQKDGYSLAAQRKHGLEYVERMGLNLVKMSEFIETASKVGQRQKFNAFFDEVKAYIAKSSAPVHLVAEKSDRVTRNFTNKEQLQFLVLTGKLVVHYYKDKKILDKDYYTIAKTMREGGDIPKGVKFTFKTVEQIFSDNNLLFYSGYFNWQGKVYKGKHPAYIPSDWIELVKSYKKGKKSNVKSGLGTYSNLFRCKDCGSAIIYVPKVRTLADGSKKTYSLYWCADSKKWHRDNRKKVRAINESKLNEVFENLLAQFAIPPKVADGISKSIRVNFENYKQEQAKKLKGVKRKVRDLEGKEDQLYHDYKGILDLEAYKRQLEKVKKDKASYSLTIDTSQKEVVGQDFYRSADEILELAKSVKLLWKSMTPLEKQLLIKKVCWNQSMDASSIYFALKKPFSVLKKMKNSGDFGKWYPRS